MSRRVQAIELSHGAVVNVVFRGDASSAIGAGHIMRCLTLAVALREAGASVSFVCRETEGHLCDRVEAKGFRVVRLARWGSGALHNQTAQETRWLGADWKQDAEQTLAALRTFSGQVDWLIADNYAIDYRWEGALRAAVGRIMVIDDLADRSHDCDLLLDQNFYRDIARRYDALVPERAIRLLGPRYALLRPEFASTRRSESHNPERRL